MLGLLEADLNENAEFPLELASYLISFIGANAGAAHPVSDRWSVSLFARFGMGNGARFFLQSCTKWVADYYDKNGFGFAGPYASPLRKSPICWFSVSRIVPLRRRREARSPARFWIWQAYWKMRTSMTWLEMSFWRSISFFQSSRQMMIWDSIVFIPVSVALSQTCYTKSIGSQEAVGSMLLIIGERSKTAMRRELTVHGISSPSTVLFVIATL